VRARKPACDRLRELVLEDLAELRHGGVVVIQTVIDDEPGAVVRVGLDVTARAFPVEKVATPMRVGAGDDVAVAKLLQLVGEERRRVEEVAWIRFIGAERIGSTSVSRPDF